MSDRFRSGSTSHLMRPVTRPIVSVRRNKMPSISCERKRGVVRTVAWRICLSCLSAVVVKKKKTFDVVKAVEEMEE